MGQEQRSAPQASLADLLVGAVRCVPDFPRPGIVFRDITPVLADPQLFAAVVTSMASSCAGKEVDLVVAVESRGFVFGGAVAHILGVGFVPIRKQGRLPGLTVSVAYELEYGSSVLEAHAGSIAPGQRVAVIDDLLATGGTACATMALVEQLGGTVACLSFLIELAGLNGSAALAGHDYSALITL